MKFRVPFQIYHAGVISRWSSPGKFLNKFEIEHKSCKNTSKIKISYFGLIRSFIYNFTHLPLKITLSKLRNKTKLRISTKSCKVNIKNEFLYLQKAFKYNLTQKKAKNYKVVNEISDCCMNSTICTNFMCAKSTAKILLQQKDFLCNKNSKKCVTANTEEEIKHLNNRVVKSTNVEKEKITNNTSKKNEEPVQMPIKEKYKPNEYKWKFNKSETVASNSEIKRIKALLQSHDENRNYKADETHPEPIRMDNVMRASYFPKKLPELPVQIVPKTEQVHLKEAPSLVSPKRKYDAPEMTRNYRAMETVQHSPTRMDNLVRCKAEPKYSTPDIKDFDEIYTPNLKQYVNISFQETKERSDTIKNLKHPNHLDFSNKPSLKHNSVVEMNNKFGNEKDIFLLKLDEVVNNLMPNTKRSTRNLQLNTANINISEKIKKFEELIELNNDQHRSTLEELKSIMVGEKKIMQGKQMEKNDYGDSLPKLSPSAVAEIRRKYYPSNTCEKEKPKLHSNTLTVQKDVNVDTKFKYLYLTTEEQCKKLDQKTLDNFSDNMKKQHARIKNSITLDNGVGRQKDLLTVIVDDINNDCLRDCSTCSTIETSTTTVIAPKLLIPPPAAPKAPENKPIYNFGKNVSYTERMVSENIKKNEEINADISKAKNIIRIESNNILKDNLKNDLRFSTDVSAINLKDQNDNSKKLDKPFISNSNSNIDHRLQANLSKRQCMIKVTSTNPYQNNAVSPVGGFDKLTRKLSYQYYHQKCTNSEDVNDFEISRMSLPANTVNEQSSATLEVNAADLITNKKYNKMLTDKTAFLNNYHKWKMQEFASSIKKCSVRSKCCLNFIKKIDKQNKYRMRKYEIIQMKKRCLGNSNLPIRQEEADSINNTVNIIKSQVVRKCALFDKISYALLKKTDIINYNNHVNEEMHKKEHKIEDFQYKKKRKLSQVPMMDNTHKTKIIRVSKMKKVILDSESKNIPYTENIENMDFNMSAIQAITDGPLSTVKEEICNKRKSVSHKISTKLKGSKPASREASRLKTIHTDKNNYLQHTLEMKPLAIPATMKSKRFLEKIKAEQKQIGISLQRRLIRNQSDRNR